MRTWTSAAVLIIAALALSACTADAPEPSPTATTAPPPVEPSGPVPPQADAAAPQACVDQELTEVVHAEGGEAIAAAAAAAALPRVVVFAPGIQVTASVDQPGMFDAAAEVCSVPLPRRSLIAVATEIALAINADPSSSMLSALVVSAWEPDDSGALQEGETIRTDFQMHSWDPDAAVPLARNWQ